MNSRYQKSQQLLQQALRSIPLGCQTFSKSTTQYPQGVSPYYAVHGKGCYLWDEDGNQYSDYINGLGAIILGYCDKTVNSAIKNQLAKGSIFSLSNKLEITLAEKLIDLIPCAEMVRFAKNGSDVTSAAIRLARAYTGKEHLLVCGYHGWQDWYIGSTTMNLGIPKAVTELTHHFQYNDIASLNKLFAQYNTQIAAVIMEPMNKELPQAEFLQNIRQLTLDNNALLIFDEMLTGFRLGLGGAQEFFGVTPDLATFGKSMANGLPLSALVGNKEFMSMLDKIFFSSTFSGETLSLAASLTCLEILENENVSSHLAETGKRLEIQLRQFFCDHEIGNFVSLSGHPAWSFLNFNDCGPYTQWEIKTLFLQEAFARNILTLGTHNLSFAHQNADIDSLVGSYCEIFQLMKEAISQGILMEKLHCEVISPLFSVR